MKRVILIVAVSAVLLAACQTKGLKEGAPDPHMPRVFVQDDAVVVVDQEPIYIAQRDSNTIVWNLDAKGPYFFPRDEKQYPGIEFIAAGERPKLTADCARDRADPRIYACTYARVPKGKYFYKITATRDDSKFVSSDPSVMNN